MQISQKKVEKSHKITKKKSKNLALFSSNLPLESKFIKLEIFLKRVVVETANRSWDNNIPYEERKRKLKHQIYYWLVNGKHLIFCLLWI